MKKIFLKSLPFFFVAALCMCLTSCGGGDDDSTGSGPQTQQQNGGGNGGETNGGVNDPQYSQQLGTPLTLEAIGNGTITFKNRAAGDVMYKVDNGATQTIAPGADGNIPVTAGQKITLFGNNATYSPLNSSEDSNISSTTDFYAYGNIMSLINSNSYNTETTLTANYTFSGLFADSPMLHSHPTNPLLLPATTLTENCYDSMFYGCSNLTTAPTLPAKTLVKECYSYMFYECSKLNHITCLASGINGDYFNYDLYMYEWVYGVAASGTFVKASDSSWIKFSSGMPSGWTVSDNTEDTNTDPGEEGEEPVYPDINSTPLTLEAISGGTITFQNKAAGNVTYRVGGYAPQTIAPNTSKTIYVTAGQKVSFFGDNKAYANGASDDDKQSNILCSEDCYIYGNIMSLIDSKNYSTTTSLTEPHTFTRLFYENKRIKNHPSKELLLPAKTLPVRCYYEMFYGCTSITAAPKLPAKELSTQCYSYMFRGCTSLTTAPELPATTLADWCYIGMFYECSSLTTAPELPATTLKDRCYLDMFSGCTSLTTAPELPATTLASSCYYAMFSDCTSLTTAPELPAKVLTSQCYARMFKNCSKLNYVKCLATEGLPDKLTMGTVCYQWLYKVSSAGTFVKASGASWPNTNVFPSGWTVKTE